MDKVIQIYSNCGYFYYLLKNPFIFVIIYIPVDNIYKNIHIIHSYAQCVDNYVNNFNFFNINYSIYIDCIIFFCTCLFFCIMWLFIFFHVYFLLSIYLSTYLYITMLINFITLFYFIFIFSVDKAAYNFFSRLKVDN